MDENLLHWLLLEIELLFQMVPFHICDLLYENGPFGIFFINIEFLTWVDSPLYVEYNGESFKSKH